jgi:hypothetical protein
MACALGRFATYGPGPFEVVGVRYSDRGVPLTLIVRAEYGDMEIDAAWLGTVPFT